MLVPPLFSPSLLHSLHSLLSTLLTQLPVVITPTGKQRLPICCEQSLQSRTIRYMASKLSSFELPLSPLVQGRTHTHGHAYTHTNKQTTHTNRTHPQAHKARAAVVIHQPKGVS